MRRHGRRGVGSVRQCPEATQAARSRMTVTSLLRCCMMNGNS